MKKRKISVRSITDDEINERMLRLMYAVSDYSTRNDTRIYTKFPIAQYTVIDGHIQLGLMKEFDKL